MAQGVAHCDDECQPCLLQGGIHTEDPALIVERMEKSCQLIYIVGDPVRRSFRRCRFHQFFVRVQ